jgi:hypothetical protein
MSKAQRILIAVLTTIVIGGMFAYQDMQKNEPRNQEYPATVILTDFFGGSLSGLIFYFGSGWFIRRKEKNLKRAGDGKLYDEIALELKEKPMIPGLWTKAFSEAGGDDAKARALYIKYRVAQLTESCQQQLEQNRAAVKAAKKQQYAEMEAARRQKLAPFHRFIFLVFAIVCMLLCGFFGLCAIACIVFASDKKEIFDSDDLILAIAGGIFCLIVAFLFGVAFMKCKKETW